MKRMVAVLLVLVLVTSARAAANAVAAHRRLEAEVKAAEAGNAALRDGIGTLRKGAEVMRTAAALMTGERKDLPPADAGEVSVLVYEPDAAAAFVRKEADGKSRLALRTLTLEAGRTYRFEAEVEAREVQPASGVKFGLRVALPNGKVDWPGASVSRSAEKASFGWRKTSFASKIPFDAKVTLIYGLSAPAVGEVRFRNVRIVRTDQ